MHQCPKCGKFVKKIQATYNEFTGQILEVTGRCYSHGKVPINDWYYEQFFPEGQESGF